jgi:large-conductance mechanosensitive channel
MLKGLRDFLLKGDLITAAVGLVMALATSRFVPDSEAPGC